MENVRKEALLLYAVTDRAWLPPNGSLAEQVERAIAGGVTCVQLREKHYQGEALREEARKVQAVCKKHRIPLILNDEVDLAREMDADGVHLGQKDMDPREARRRLGPKKVIGVSARTVAQALTAQESGADYLGVGAAFPTGSKEDAQVIDHATLRDICKAVQIPVVAIGGIQEENIRELSGSGICGIAVISAIFAKPDIEQAARRLRAEIEKRILP